MEAELLHIPKRKTSRVIHDVYRWLKPNGVFGITVVEGNDEGLCENFMGNGVPIYLSYYRARELKNMLTDAGFNTVKTRDLYIKTENFEETELFFLARK